MLIIRNVRAQHDFELIASERELQINNQKNKYVVVVENRTKSKQNIMYLNKTILILNKEIIVA